MQTVLYFLVALTLNAQTGGVVSRKAISKPIDGEACVTQQATKSIERTTATNPPRITIYRCEPLQGETAT